MRERISSAHVLAVIAIVLALGGNALAFTLGKNSVGAKQLKKSAVTTAKLKKEAVTAAKVKKGTLTGTQINLASLGTVPSAANAANAQALDGQSASQLTSASKLHCPSAMALYDGVCYQEAQSGTKWTVAAAKCWGEHLRLPTLGELIGFERNNLTKEPPEEWAEPLWYSGENVAWVASAAEHVLSYHPAPASLSYAYRCVILASN